MRSPELAAKICEGLASGLSLRKVCEVEGIPKSTLLDWVDEDEAFGVRYARARAKGYQNLAEELVEISDNPDEDHNRSRLRLDTRKWLLSKMIPKVYGDKITAEVTGKLLIVDDFSKWPPADV